MRHSARSESTRCYRPVLAMGSWKGRAILGLRSDVGLASKDGGRTWRTTASPHWSIEDLCALGPRDFLAIAQGTVFSTRDTAETWKVAYRCDEMQFAAMSTTDSGTVVGGRVIGGQGRLVKTSLGIVGRSKDSGQTWRWRSVPQLATADVIASSRGGRIWVSGPRQQRRQWAVGYLTRDTAKLHILPSACDALVSWGSGVLIGRRDGWLMKLGVRGAPKAWIKLPIAKDECIIGLIRLANETTCAISDHGVWLVTKRESVKRLATYHPSCYYAAATGGDRSIVLGVFEGRIKRIDLPSVKGSIDPGTAE